MLALSTLALLLAASTADPHPAALVGNYDGGQMEIAAELDLKADGRFEYALSYGALDEEAEGRWHAEQGRVVLDGDPVTPPHFTFLGQTPAPPQTVHVDLDGPAGIDRQLFEAIVRFADGATDGGQLSDDGLSLALKDGRRPTAVRIALPMYEVASDPVTVDPTEGLGFRFRFEPHDIGKADLRGAALAEEGGVLVFSRFDRTLRFRRVK
ncbi:MAG: hypothetical protein JOY99_15285 [Sphingomonadaceae bacterium]|nr:hypothetical protein [Sphingomonadaceae bacterium]